MRFTMPYGQYLEIQPSRELTDDEADFSSDDEIKDVIWSIFWNDKSLPWSTKTRLQAYAIALGCQWGAFEIAKKINND